MSTRFSGPSISIRWLLLAGLLLAFAIPAAGATQPNFILIMTDDMNAVEAAFMPILQAEIAAKGVTFENYFVVSSICCPSRVSTLRGQYVHNHGVLTNTSPNGGFLKFHNLGEENSTIATWLQSAGYRTVLMGKYLNGYGTTTQYQTYVPPGWDEWYALIVNQAYFNYKMNHNGQVVQYGSAASDYQTDVLANLATDYIRRTAGDPRPFMMYLAPTAPHSPFQPAARHSQAFPDASVPRVPSFNEADVSDKPAFIRALPLMDSNTIGRLDKDYRRRLQMLLPVDEMISGILTALTDTGALDNTYIIFTSDNGWAQGEHRLNNTNDGKGTAYDESIRVPMIVRGPGTAPGTVRDNVVANIDIAPTLVELASGGQPPLGDGESLVNQLAEATPPPTTRSILVEYLAGPKVPLYRALRSRDTLYVDYFQVGEKEFYDLNIDSYLLDNSYPTADPQLLIDQAAKLTNLSTCVDSGCVTAGQ